MNMMMTKMDRERMIEIPKIRTKMKKQQKKKEEEGVGYARDEAV